MNVAKSVPDHRSSSRNIPTESACLLPLRVVRLNEVEVNSRVATTLTSTLFVVCLFFEPWLGLIILLFSNCVIVMTLSTFLPSNRSSLPLPNPLEPNCSLIKTHFKVGHLCMFQRTSPSCRDVIVCRC